MKKVFNFKTTLQGLLEQIPEGRLSTYQIISDALGDRLAERTVKKILEEIGWNIGKVVDKLEKEEAFSDFMSESPLEKLADYQLSLGKKVIVEDVLPEPNLVAGVDIAYHENIAYAACVVMDSQFNIIDSGCIALEIPLPYIPSYLAFREGPLIFSVLEQVTKFDALIVNGHGFAHPRGCGLATYVGLNLRKPTIGVARRLLVGKVTQNGGRDSPIVYEGDIVGTELRTPSGGRIYVSVGNMISLNSACNLIWKFIRNGPLPEPLKQAHKLARIEKTKNISKGD